MTCKRLLSLALALGLTLTLAIPAAAAESADAALSRVTQTVKDTLDLDTEEYDEFYGNRYEDGFTALWSLHWSGADGSLSMEALDDGTIVSYRLNQEEPVNTGSFPAFPQGDMDAAARTAGDFLEKVLAAGESVTLEEPRGMENLGGDSYRFSGAIHLNGLPSPLTYAITVRASDNQVTSFRRDVRANTFLGDVPAVTQDARRGEAAEEALRGTLAVKLEYVLGEDGASAVLRYLPEETDTYYVDASTGELLNLTELMASMGASLGGSSGAESDSATGDAGDNGLSQAEQEGIAKLEGVLSSQTLDSRLRAQSVYGLGAYALASASYQRIEATEEGEEDQILCTLSYVQSGEDYHARTITVDARTGAVESVYSHAPSLEEGETPGLTEEQARGRAEDFLEGFCAARWPDLALYDSQNDTENRRPYYTFTYVQHVNGIPYPGNAYTVAIDSTDGSVYRLGYQYDDTVTFASPEGIVDEARALAAWADTYETVLAYRLVPRALDSGNALEARLLELGMTHFFALRGAYALEREETCLGIDAATGEPVWVEAYDSTLAYTDVEGAWVQADVEKLAAYGIGYDGGVFRHRKNLTQWDLVALLASLEGYRIDPENADKWTVDAAYSTAYRMGAIRRGERDEDRAVTRGELVKCLLNCAGYGPAASLQGIYTCSYSDASSISEADLGYAAIAQALGMVGDRYDGSRTATRGELAAMLCRLLER